MKIDLASVGATVGALAQWSNLLGGALTGGIGTATVAIKAIADIKAALSAAGIEADTAQLDFVIADAATRKAHEDDILGAPTEG